MTSNNPLLAAKTRPSSNAMYVLIQQPNARVVPPAQRFGCANQQAHACWRSEPTHCWATRLNEGK
jgi:hypothetical protein